MWSAFRLLVPSAPLSANYSDFNADTPFPATLSAAPGSVNLTLMFRVMRDYYQGTPYDLSVGLAAG